MGDLLGMSTPDPRKVDVTTLIGYKFHISGIALYELPSKDTDSLSRLAPKAFMEFSEK